MMWFIEYTIQNISILDYSSIQRRDSICHVSKLTLSISTHHKNIMVNSISLTMKSRNYQG
ncbi:hypothetical protein M2263_000308 [Providencia alcalifaciens]|nr:hypothetical protein [Providencia alcalifaciens]